MTHPQHLLLLLLLVAATPAVLSTWLGEEYWTSVGFNGQLLQGRTTADFVRLDAAESNLFVAFWITRSRYAPEHFEAFGWASVRPDGRTCGWFVGFHKEPIEVCGGFRVLSYPLYQRDQKIFEWVPTQPAYNEDRAAIGYQAHAIAKYADGSRFIYGDAIPVDRRFAAVQRDGLATTASNSEYAQQVSLLRLIGGLPPIPRPPAPAPRPPPPPPRPPQPDYPFVQPAPVPSWEERRAQFVQDQDGTLYERRVINGRTYYYQYFPDERLFGFPSLEMKRTPQPPKPLQPRFYQIPTAVRRPYVQPRPYEEKVPTRALLPDHHRADGGQIGSGEVVHGHNNGGYRIGDGARPAEQRDDGYRLGDGARPGESDYRIGDGTEPASRESDIGRGADLGAEPAIGEGAEYLKRRARFARLRRVVKESKKVAKDDSVSDEDDEE